jgi:DNA-directed RNA polymerase specialized sigma54-like protein
MSEAENLELDNEVEAEVESNPVMDLINALQGQDFNGANDTFNNILGDKVAQSLDAYKVDIADQIFNGVEADEEPAAELEDGEVDLEDDSFEDVEFGSEAEDFGDESSEFDENDG